MELLVLASRYIKQPERERVVMQSVIEAAEAVGAERIVMRRGNVYSTGVYLKDGGSKSLVYNDWEKDWSRRKVYENMLASLQFSPRFHHEQQILIA